MRAEPSVRNEVHTRRRDPVAAPSAAPIDPHPAPPTPLDQHTEVPVGNVYDKEATRHRIERRLVSGFSGALLDLVPRRLGSVLEVGCGEGCQLRKVADAVAPDQMVGFDLPSPTLASRWTGLDADMVCGTGTSLPFRSDSFDLVLALEMLEHVDDPDAVLAEIARVARRTVILSVPWEPAWRIGNLARGRYLSDLGNTPGHVQHFSRSSFRRLVDHHLHVTQVRRPFPWTFVQAEVRGGRGAP